ncbi:hypothetical protein TcasGA2_TC034814 [Tribolium castaneum]|uniref:Uncharacterized protein n=1 Tax=Tribolium castaneum TaxID=7070 RepID=A0A139WF44_TRICA|nr:hypothetical protein TcasGA2_TC034814 [Tribolium castaneum]
MNTSTEILTKRHTEVMEQGASARKPQVQQVFVGWDRQKSFTFLGLSLCFVVWACVYFPLMS